ncbi:Bestrophin, RFP-TM, chloride channel-domain-containing protein [Obelidium mucronatum]|nr:Bestrophin, RFP-TM, chloride channel-domain-containing protein [Obelidium mucronatum]
MSKQLSPTPSRQPSKTALSLTSNNNSNNSNNNKSPVRSHRLSNASSLLERMTDIQEVVDQEVDSEPIVTNTYKESWFDFITAHNTVFRKVLAPATVFTVWGAIWTVVYMLTSWRTLYPNSQALISVISFVVALILGYRTNTAYDRFWEARRGWGSLVTHSRNLARAIWCSSDAKGNAQYELERAGAINLILAYAVATKHLLRDEVGHNYTDLAHLLIHVPKFRPGSHNQSADSVPVDIILLLTDYTRVAEENGVIDGTTKTLMNGSIGGLIECLTNFERIRNTPIPLAYAIHLKHILCLYLISLPFQTCTLLGWLTIPVTAIAAFTLLGIEAVSNEIEQPFGYDADDLDLNEFCNELRLELHTLMQTPVDGRGVKTWDMKARSRSNRTGGSKRESKIDAIPE